MNPQSGKIQENFQVFECKKIFKCLNVPETLKSVETADRGCLVYSVHRDCVYCFCCRIFSKNNKTRTAPKIGCRDWKNLYLLQVHGKWTFCIFSMWQEMAIRLKLNKTTNFILQWLLMGKFNF